MAYVIGPTCIGTIDRSCVEVCPADCIVGADDDLMLFIDPDECIDCSACLQPCPVDAIYPEDELPEKWREFADINRIYFKDRDRARVLVEAWVAAQ